MGGSKSKVETYEFVFGEEIEEIPSMSFAQSSKQRKKSGSARIPSRSARIAASVNGTPNTSISDDDKLATPIQERTIFQCSRTVPWILKNVRFKALVLSDFEFGCLLGVGRHSKVRLAKIKNKASYLAIKAVPKADVIKNNDFHRIEEERKALLLMHSPFIIKLFGTFQNSSYLFFALELTAGGELLKGMNRQTIFGPQTTKFYATEICAALLHIHGKGYCHRDIRPENILLDEDGHCKIVDFGYARPCISDEVTMSTICGSLAYQSPEQLTSKFTGYTRTVDWWSFGVLIVEMMTGKTPFAKSPSDSPNDIYSRIFNQKIKFPSDIDADTKIFVQQLLTADFTERLKGGDSISSHSYFNLDWNKVNRRRLLPPYVPKFAQEGDVHFKILADANENDMTGEVGDDFQGFEFF